MSDAVENAAAAPAAAAPAPDAAPRPMRKKKEKKKKLSKEERKKLREQEVRHAVVPRAVLWHVVLVAVALGAACAALRAPVLCAHRWLRHSSATGAQCVHTWSGDLTRAPCARVWTRLPSEWRPKPATSSSSATFPCCSQPRSPTACGRTCQR